MRKPASNLLDAIADQLVDKGYYLQHQALDHTLCEALRARITSLDEEAFRRAGIGRDQDHQIDTRIRSDQIRWLGTQDQAESDYLAWMEALRLGMNERLFMGLFDYECHFAHYPQGAFYQRHLDAFKGRTNRVLTTVFYLNQDWGSDEGGELLLYDESGTHLLESVAPENGTLLVFLSDRFPHEVLPTRRDRYSIAGWFRVNASLNHHLDPPR